MGITIDAEPVQPLEVTLVGKEYKVIPPKASALMAISDQAKGKDENDMGLDDVKSFVEALFEKKDVNPIMKRLTDSTDRLDVDHIMTLLEKVMETVQEHPTTS